MCWLFDDHSLDNGLKICENLWKRTYYSTTEVKNLKNLNFHEMEKVSSRNVDVRILSRKASSFSSLYNLSAPFCHFTGHFRNSILHHPPLLPRWTRVTECIFFLVLAYVVALNNIEYTGCTSWSLVAHLPSIERWTTKL